MNATESLVETKLAELMELAPDVRLQLGERLIESVPVFADPEVERAWSEEIARRIRDIDEGRVQGIPAEEAFRRVRERLNDSRHEASAGGRRDC